MTTHPFTENAAEDALIAIDGMMTALCELCEHHGLEGVSASQFQFVVAIHALADVAARAGLTPEYVLDRVGVFLPRAMAAHAADEADDFKRGGGVPS